MNNFKIYIRNKLVQFFTSKIIIIEKNNKIINNKFYLFFINLLFFINFQQIIKIFKINYLYSIDNIYFYEDYKKNNKIINPIILSAKIVCDENEIDFLNNFKKYNFSIPINIILYNEKIFNYKLIILKIFKLGKEGQINIDIKNDNKFKKLCELL